MADAIRVSGPVNAAGLTLSLETGRLAQLADGAVLVQLGETTLLTTVVTSTPREGIDFFPLTVDVEERMYAAGKIPGSFFRREGRPGEQAVLTCRLTDRPLRPSFPEGFRNEVQVISTILGADLENPHDVASINGASAALMVSGIPFNGPIGAVRIAQVDGEWIAHPTYQQGDESTFEMVVAGRVLHDGDVAIMMVEAGGTDATWRLYEAGAPKVTEDVIAAGIEFSKQWIKASSDLQLELVSKVQEAHGPIATIEYAERVDYQPDAFDAVADAVRDETSTAMQIADKHDRNLRLDEIESAITAELVGSDDAPGAFAGRGGELRKAFRSLQKQVVRSRIVNDGMRIDGRGLADLRQISADVGIIPTAHGTGPLPARRDPGAQRRDARHAPHGADARHDRHRRPQALHAPLQLPAVLDRRDRSSGFAEASRDRPRRARRAGARPGAPRQDRVGLHDARRLRRARIERLHVDGVGLRLDALPHGRRRADQGAGRRHRDGPRVPRRQVRHPHRHPRHRRTRSATWTSRSPARASS